MFRCASMLKTLIKGLITRIRVFYINNPNNAPLTLATA